MGKTEDIIRETFSSLAKAIGVQIDIPDEMIANLAARLQAQIDLLAELQSAGRLLADDEQRLTAEQVEDVRALVWLDGRRNFDAFHRLRALFPATEPAEVTGQDFLDAMPTEPDCWDVCEGHPAPAEPAEEETKAELPTEVGDRIRASVTRWSSALEWPDSNPYIDTFVLSSSGFWDAENDQFTVVPSCFSYIEVLEVLPSPVVPAPTETEAGHA